MIARSHNLCRTRRPNLQLSVGHCLARTALSSAELATSGGPIDRDGSYYRITVALNAQQVTAYGKPQPLQAGMALKADVLQERRRLYEWVLEPLYSLTGKL
ncbi:bacteriocin secretion protein [Burkholderia contaminans]|nr:bacteriocin secretion protein [Burkholderia contaminans]